MICDQPPLTEIAFFLIGDCNVECAGSYPDNLV